MLNPHDGLALFNLILWVIGILIVIRVGMWLLGVIAKLISYIKIIVLKIKEIYYWFKMKRAKKDYDETAEQFQFEGEETTQEKTETRETYSSKRSQCFKILGLREGATLNELKHAYYKLAQKYHPDKYPFAEDKIKYGKVFIEIKDAYEYLTK